MPETLRFIVNRLRDYVGNRRRVPRYHARLAASLSLFQEKSKVNGARHTQSLEGYTRDLSVNGLALILPAIRIGERYLTDGRTLRVTLELPNGPIQMHVIAVRYERLEEDPADKGYLIGARITAMSDTDRESFADYLETIINAQ
ncbi:MAG: PilZ domain-containing protein [Pyrinomonadaceae bacterium]